MSNQLETILPLWYADKDRFKWALCTIIKVTGSSYRKAGAMMLVNDMGQMLGMLSGGCLEKDLQKQAKQCWQGGTNRVTNYCFTDDSEGWQLGLGCGGDIDVLVQPINQENGYLDLPNLLAKLSSNEQVFYVQNVAKELSVGNICMPENPNITRLNQFDLNTTTETFTQLIKPVPIILICGGGPDAVPLTNILHILGWKCIVVDERVAYARKTDFPTVSEIKKIPFAKLHDYPELKNVDAIICMTHQVNFDALSLSFAQHTKANFVGLLGPTHRTTKVLKMAGLSYASLTKPLSNPIGLDIGGQLPESIALSIVSQIHSVLEGRSSISQTAGQNSCAG